LPIFAEVIPELILMKGFKEDPEIDTTLNQIIEMFIAEQAAQKTWFHCPPVTQMCSVAFL
jgi:hypothetical protein